jgi:hypothetical protein
MRRTIKTEYNSGFASGMLYDCDSFLHRENLVKCRKGQTNSDPLVKAYWQGYGAALDSRLIPTLAGL